MQFGQPHDVETPAFGAINNVESLRERLRVRLSLQCGKFMKYAEFHRQTFPRARQSRHWPRATSTRRRDPALERQHHEQQSDAESPGSVDGQRLHPIADLPAAADRQAFDRGDNEQAGERRAKAENYAGPPHRLAPPAPDRAEQSAPDAAPETQAEQARHAERRHRIEREWWRHAQLRKVEDVKERPGGLVECDDGDGSGDEAKTDARPYRCHVACPVRGRAALLFRGTLHQTTRQHQYGGYRRGYHDPTIG